MKAEYVREIAEITREERRDAPKQGTLIRVGFASSNEEIEAMWMDGTLSL